MKCSITKKQNVDIPISYETLCAVCSMHQSSPPHSSKASRSAACQYTSAHSQPAASVFVGSPVEQHDPRHHYSLVVKIYAILVQRLPCGRGFKSQSVQKLQRRLLTFKVGPLKPVTACMTKFDALRRFSKLKNIFECSEA